VKQGRYMRTISKITYDSEKDRQTTNVYLIPTVGDGDCFFHAADHSNQVDENDAIEYDFISPYPSQVKADQYITDAQVNQLKCSISEEIFNVPVILNFMVDDNGEEVASSEIYEREVIIKVIADMFFALKENVNLLEDQHGYLKWQGKPTQIRKQQLSKLVKEDYNLILLNDLIDIEPEQACSDTIYLSLSGRYYIRDGGGILQQGRIADMLITRLPPIELTDLKFKAEIIKDIIYQGHTMLIVSHSSKKREVLECLQQPGMQDAKIYLPQSWQNDLCWLICNKTDWHEENRRADIIKCLQQDKRLLSIKLTYIVPDDAIAINNTIQCSAFYLASKFGSFNIVLDLLTELSQNDCIDIIIQEKSTAMYQLGTNLPHLDRALKESLGALNGSIKQLDLLLQLGANILQTDQAGNTLLHYMTSVDNIQALWLLKTAGQLKSILNNDGNTALHLAILANNEQLIDLLLKHKVDVTIANKEGGTPLHLAVTHSNPSLVKRLCKLGARKNIHDKNNAQHTPIFIASTTQREDILQILVGDEFLMPLQLVLHLAIEVDDSILLSWWLENGGNLEVRNNNKQTPLCLAVVKENLVAIQILLSKGADLSAIVDERLKQNVFHVAAKNNKILKLLLKELVTRETELQFMINNRDINGDTPLHLAAAVGNEESIVLLINAGASPGQPNNDFLVPSKRFNNHDKNSLDVLILFSQVGEKLSNPISYDTLIRKKISNPQSQCLKICTPLATNRVLICTDIMQIFDTAEKKTIVDPINETVV
jgi:ankyrin repeat protein